MEMLFANSAQTCIARICRKVPRFDLLEWIQSAQEAFASRRREVKWLPMQSPRQSCKRGKNAFLRFGLGFGVSVSLPNNLKYQKPSPSPMRKTTSPFSCTNTVEASKAVRRRGQNIEATHARRKLLAGLINRR